MVKDEGGGVTRNTGKIILSDKTVYATFKIEDNKDIVITITKTKTTATIFYNKVGDKGWEPKTDADKQKIEITVVIEGKEVQKNEFSLIFYQILRHFFQPTLGDG